MSLIHPTANIASGAEIDSSVELGANVIVGPHVRIAKGTRVMANAIIDGHTTIGEDNEIGYFTLIGGKPQDLKYKDEPTRLEIGDRNSFREYASVHLGTVTGGAVTKIGNDCLLMGYSHIAHDCIVQNNVIVANASLLAGHVILEDWVTLGGGVAISQFLTVGKHSYIGGHSAIDKDIAPYSLAYGNRVKVRGINVVGLKRRGIEGDNLRNIIQAHKIYFEGDKEKAQKLTEIEELFQGNEHIEYFVNFIRESKYGIAK